MNESDLTTILLDWSKIFTRLTLHDLNRFTRNAGLTLAQMNVLMHLHYRSPSEVSNFCEMMQISPAGASQMIERMVQSGLVQRHEIPGDRRVRLVELTDHGRQIIQESLLSRLVWINQLVEALPIEERQSISTILLKLNEFAAKLDIRP